MKCKTQSLILSNFKKERIKKEKFDMVYVE